MIKHYFIRTFIAIILIVGKSFIWNCNSQAQIKNAQYKATSWKKYTNAKFGFTFQYPSSWSKQGKDAEIIDLSGSIVAIGIFFSDTATQTTLSIEYHLAPHGSKLYKYALSQYNSSQGLYAKDGKTIKVAGGTAIKASNISKVDGKGHILNPPLRLIVVNFLDALRSGEIEMQFNTPIRYQNIEITKLNQLLSSFAFMKN